jgi:hypothetical protein
VRRLDACGVVTSCARRLYAYGEVTRLYASAQRVRRRDEVACGGSTMSYAAARRGCVRRLDEAACGDSTMIHTAP